jgi:hypothetical protein
MANGYIAKEVARAIKDNENSLYFLRMKLQGDSGETRWVNLSKKEAQKILEVFTEKDEEDNKGGYGCKEEDEG